MTAPALARPITEEGRVLVEFVATLTDPRAPWAERCTVWAQERGLSAAEARALRLNVLRLRMFGAMERHAARRRHR